jgi:hypothetical protein
MLNAIFRPVHQWPKQPTPSYRRKSAAFRATYAATLDLLESELSKLGAKEIIIQAYFTLDQIRNDGWPKSAAHPSDVGVIVSFQTKKGPLAFPCDTYDTYDDNLRAIALSLQALRAVDRYGVTQHAEQYKGFTPLPSAEAQMSKEDAAHFIATHQNGGQQFHVSNILQNPHVAAEAYRAAARQLHPDIGGDHDLFVKLQQAKTVLGI